MAECLETPRIIELGVSSSYHRLFRGNWERLYSQISHPDISSFSHRLLELQSKEDELRGRSQQCSLSVASESQSAGGGQETLPLKIEKLKF